MFSVLYSFRKNNFPVILVLKHGYITQKSVSSLKISRASRQAHFM